MTLVLTILGHELLTIDTTTPHHDTGETTTSAWWAIPHQVLTELLHRAHQGEEPEMLVVELAANSD